MMSFRVPSRQCGCREDTESGQTTKTIIFCTFTKALDLMQRRLDEASARWVRLDGKMRLSQRTDATREFALNPEVGRKPNSASTCLQQLARCILAQIPPMHAAKSKAESMNGRKEPRRLWLPVRPPADPHLGQGLGASQVRCSAAAS